MPGGLKFRPSTLESLKEGAATPPLRSIGNISAGVSLCELFDFDLEDKDENALRKEICRFLQGAKLDVLRVAHRALKP